MASSDERRMEAVAVAVAVVGFLEYRDVPPVSFSFDI